MELVLAIIFISVLYGGLLTFSVWYLWMGPEAVFSVPDLRPVLARTWHAVAGAESFRPAPAAPDELTKMVKKLEDKLAALKVRRAELCDLLHRDYSQEVFRELNIVEHKITVTEARLQGYWNAAEDWGINIKILK